MSSAWARIPGPARRAVGRLPQTAAAAALARRATRNALRVPALHDVHDLAGFTGLVRAVLDRYTPVDAGAVAAAVRGETRLPDHAVWFTFDDGLPSTFAAGELLAGYGIRATAFVCPGVIDTRRRLWFQTVVAADAAGLIRGPERVTYATARLKRLPDPERRGALATLEARLAAHGDAGPDPVSVADLETWRAHGHTVGNHTWDHPCLDTCDRAQQVEQVARAHEALAGWGFETDLFAYPNGDYAEASAETLRDLGYAVGLLFDHRLTRSLSAPLALSRLRLDSDAGPRRALSVLSGAHSAALHLATR